MNLVRSLMDPAAYPAGERPDRVELAETHISWLFHAGKFVYKVKKPVDYGFLDFSTLDQRRFYCQQELELNRRLSPDVYLGVVPIGEKNGTLAIGVTPALEWAVKMRRLPDGRWLSQLLDRGEATPEMIRAIARRIAAFHAAAATSDHIRATGGIATVRFNTEENFAQTIDQIGVTLSAELHDRVAGYTRAFLDARATVFAAREAAGRIRDCHGDLHADQICLDNGIAFIDCIEFNERFRFGDVAADIAFTAMDLEYHGHPELARVLVDEFVAASNDPGVLEVVDFYQCYRAFTRGKVRGFRLRQPLEDADRRQVVSQSSRYFELAGRLARLPGPLLIATSGLMGTGKSSLARELAARLDALVVSSDVVRKELAGLGPSERRQVDWGQGIYGEEMTARTYQALHQRAREGLLAGRIVIVDASYREARWRAEARAAATAAGSPFLLLAVTCGDLVLRQRLAARLTGPSDGRLELLDRQQLEFEPPTELPAAEQVAVDTSSTLAESTRTALTAVYRARLASG